MFTYTAVSTASQLPRQLEGLPVFVREGVALFHMFHNHLVLSLKNHALCFSSESFWSSLNVANGNDMIALVARYAAPPGEAN